MFVYIYIYICYNLNPILLILFALLVLLILPVRFPMLPKPNKVHSNRMTIIQNSSKPMKCKQNPSTFQKSTQHGITSNQNQCKPIKTNSNRTYMHNNRQRKRKSKNNSLLHNTNKNIYQTNIFISNNMKQTVGRTSCQDSLPGPLGRTCW